LGLLVVLLAAVQVGPGLHLHVRRRLPVPYLQRRFLRLRRLRLVASPLLYLLRQRLFDWCGVRRATWDAVCYEYNGKRYRYARGWDKLSYYLGTG